MPKSESSAELHWKSKYRLLLDEYEQLTSQSKLLLIDLVEFSRNLGYMVDTDDSSLKNTLQALVKAFHKDPHANHLSFQLKAIIQKVTQIESERDQVGKEILLSIKNLTQQLSVVIIDKTERKRLRVLNKNIETATRKNTAVTQTLISNWLKQLSFLPSDIKQEQTKPALGFWEKIFKTSPNQNLAEQLSHEPKKRELKLKAEPANQQLQSDEILNIIEDNIDDKSVEKNEELFAIDSVSTQVGSYEASTQNEPQLSADVAAILLEILACIEIPFEHNEQAENLYLELQNGLTTSELVPALEGTADIIVATLRRDQIDFEKFLSLLDESLVAFQAFFVDYDVQHTDILNMNKVLGSKISEKISTLHANLSDADNITVLKERVTHNLDSISELMLSFNQGHNKKMEALEGQVHGMAVHIKNLEDSAEQAKVELQKQRDKALSDTLTQLANREAYDFQFNQEYKRSERYNRPLAFAIVDIDFFKKINDNYGHAAGDKVLSIIAKLLRKNFRESDFVARYGGEEFAIIFPETKLNDLDVVLEKVRRAVENCPFKFKAEPLKITVSIGATELAKDDTKEEFFERADRALYRAKNEGRNRVCYYDGKTNR